MDHLCLQVINSSNDLHMDFKKQTWKQPGTLLLHWWTLMETRNATDTLLAAYWYAGGTLPYALLVPCWYPKGAVPVPYQYPTCTLL